MVDHVCIFDLPIRKEKHCGNTNSFQDAVKKGAINTAMLIGELNRLSIERYGGRLQCEPAAKEGLGQFVETSKAAARNTVINRLRGSENGIGIAMAIRDRDTGKQLIVHPRVRTCRTDLSNSTFTAESERESDIGLLLQGWVLLVVVDAAGCPFKYGFYSIKELRRIGSLKKHETRETSFRGNLLDKLYLGDFQSGSRLIGFIKNRAMGIDVVGCLLNTLAEQEK